MTPEQRKQTRRECESYCAACTDAQLQAVYSDETERAKRGGEVGARAEVFAHAAREELIRRGLL